MKISSVGRHLLANRAFDIEFNGYLSNHAKHAVVALEGLQAPKDRVKEYWDGYTSLTPYNLALHPADFDVEPCTPSQWTDWRGQKTHWPEQVLLFLNEELERFGGDTDRLVQEYATADLLAGQAGALTHGIIHLGWAIAADSPWMITEGLAYLNFCHLGVDPSKFTLDVAPSETRLWDSLERISQTFEDERLATTWVAAAKASHDKSFHPELVPAGFQWELSKVLHDAHPVATNIPAWLSSSSEDLWKNLYEDVYRLYLATRDKHNNGNFLVLHAITSLWALEHTLRVINRESVTQEALQQYYSMLVCILATSGFPKVLTKGPVDTDPEDFDWNPIVQRGIAEVEEHNIKLVHVSRELWRRYGRWSGFSEAASSFTLTPNVGPATTAFVAQS